MRKPGNLFPGVYHQAQQVVEKPSTLACNYVKPKRAKERDSVRTIQPKLKPLDMQMVIYEVGSC